MLIIMQRTLSAMTPGQLNEFAAGNPSAERKMVNEEIYYVIQ